MPDFPPVQGIYRPLYDGRNQDRDNGGSGGSGGTGGGSRNSNLLTGAAVAATMLGTAGAEKIDGDPLDRYDWIATGLIGFNWTSAMMMLLMVIVLVESLALLVMALNLSGKKNVIVVNAGAQAEEPDRPEPPAEPPAAAAEPAAEEPRAAPEEVPPPPPTPPTHSPRTENVSVTLTGACFHRAGCSTLQHSEGVRTLRGCRVCQP